ncbi:UDP-N-acetylglucosamine 2-epimerase [uncultured Vagococcus sp.]|uniref:UDP-N-acetylglucosamine 2-epimerase n=1 Tax=uncultured Vagococcus sp. TaxID=189676 RepID=UPI0028D73A54|nr:UDP-N-acetylglucosamine 2-epimerase [uncultured Vagococcus sp.]
MKKICVVTGTRAEYGLLFPLLEKLKNSNDFQLQLLVTGSHLSPEFGNTYEMIEADGFLIDEKVEILLSSDSSIGISKSMGLAIISFSESLERLKPDMVIVLGDRYEIFMAAAACSVARIPISHLHGGETTEGAFDEAFRHSITKMSWLHFTSTEAYRQRVIQLGENPERVFNVGAIGIETINRLQLMTKSELEGSLDLTFKENLYLVTFHPVTLENKSSEAQFKELVKSLDKLTDATIVFTKANSDTDGRIINQLIDEYVTRHADKAVAYNSMGQLRYLSAMKIATAVVGNSSSGIIEAPYFNVPTINIGDRQKGRIQASTIINCEAEELLIDEALNHATVDSKTTGDSVHGEGNVSDQIIDQIKKSLDKGISLKKTFYDIK